MEQHGQSSVCKQKLVEMQKYLPFLDKIIERMKCLAGKAEVVLQMEQLHLALLGDIPDENVKIKDLRKCEAVLMEIYNDNDDSYNNSELENSKALSDEETTTTTSMGSIMANEIMTGGISANNDDTNKTIINAESVKDVEEHSNSIKNNPSIPVTHCIVSECEKTLQKNAEEFAKTSFTTSPLKITTDIVLEVESDTSSHSPKVQITNAETIADNMENIFQPIMEPENLHDLKRNCIETAVQDKNNFVTTIETVNNMNDLICKINKDCEDTSSIQAVKIDTDQNNALVEIMSKKSALKKIKDFPNTNFTEDGIQNFEKSKNTENGTNMENVNKTDICRQRNCLIEMDVNDKAECDYEDYEENIELIKIPEDTVDEEMILPDSADESEQSELSVSNYAISTVEKMCNNDKTTENTTRNCERDREDKNETNQPKKTGSYTIKSHEVKVKELTKVRSEPLTTQIDTTDNTSCSDETLKLESENVNLLQEVPTNNDDINDITIAEDNTKANHSKDHIPTENVGTDSIADDDDDDVQIIEPQNSPIYILSDDDDDLDNTINVFKPASTVKVIKKPLQRAVAYKSTARVAQSRNILQKTKSQYAMNYSQMDTIKLLDSSDEESNCIVIQDHKRKLSNTESTVKCITPKRKLLPTQKKPTSMENKKLSKQPLPLFKNHVVICGKKKPVPPTTLPTHTPTPQSNFLNAINLQPATAGENPPAFCATISNKNIIIPNAFYGNPKRSTSLTESEETSTSQKTTPKMISKNTSPPSPSAVTTPVTTTTGKKSSAPLIIPASVHKVYREWLNNFLIQFTRPRQLATHTCFVLLQRVLKYKSFTRIKDMRTRLNTMAYNSTEHIDMPLYQELKNIFYRGKQLSEIGLRFCQVACTTLGNNVILTTDAHTGYVTTRTCWVTESLKNDLEEVDSLIKKRTDEDVEYTPGKQYTSTGKTGITEVRRKSLRKQRSRCYDERFLYDEADMVETTEEIERKQAEAEVQRKIEEKRLEAQRHRQQQAKSFENAYIEMFTKNANKNFPKMTQTTKVTSCTVNNPATPQSSSNSPILFDDVNSVDDLDDDEPKQHRIYKIIPTKLVAAPKQIPRIPKTKQQKPRLSIVEPEVITCDSIESDASDSTSELVPLRSKQESIPSTERVPMNTNIHMHPLSGKSDWCVICNCRVARIVDHYVNKHRNTEVYISRLTKARVDRLRRNKGNMAQVSFYKTGQLQYEALCAFCNRMKRFMLPYWQHHFAMHTGEYAYRCNGCGLRKPTRSPMTLHMNKPCHKRGKVQIDYHYGAKLKKNIEGFICTLCNYTQLHRHNVLQHLRSQHNLCQILPHHMTTIALLSIPNVPHDSNEQSLFKQTNLAIDDDSNEPHVVYERDDYPGAQAGQWDEGDTTDEMSLMIFGMLDVQMNEN